MPPPHIVGGSATVCGGCSNLLSTISIPQESRKTRGVPTYIGTRKRRADKAEARPGFASATERPYPSFYRTLCPSGLAGSSPPPFSPQGSNCDTLGVRLWLCHPPNRRGSHSDEELWNVPPFREVCPRLEERAPHPLNWVWGLSALSKKIPHPVRNFKGRGTILSSGSVK